MLREYVVSEAMHALGIPTTRSLAVVATGRPVQRETPLPGAVLARVASSHLRVGSFQYAAATGDVDLLRRLADHAIARHHPTAAAAENPYVGLLEAVVAAQASLVAQWMLIGFVHGVMNTDNMTISGETIDYGPCAFMDAFDPATVFSSIDHWRPLRLRQPAGDRRVEPGPLRRMPAAAVRRRPGQRSRRSPWSRCDAFRPLYGAAWSAGMSAKLGLSEHVSDDVTADDDLLGLLEQSQVDCTSFFRALAARHAATPSRHAACSPTSPGSTRGWRGGAPWIRTPPRWTGSTPSTSPATISSRRRWPPRRPTTSDRCTDCWTRSPRRSTSAAAWSATPSPRPGTSVRTAPFAVLGENSGPTPPRRNTLRVGRKPHEGTLT